jgi:phospholipid/cholesterol/gamma-HCH transport system substrate-binding protein
MAARVALGAVAVLVAVVLLTSGGKDPYRLRLNLANASGLRNGSDVVSGGVKIGEVRLRLGAGDRVIADLEIDPAHGPVGRDVRAAISAVNFLGRKRVELATGDRRDPAPPGFAVPSSRVTTSTDLDQVVNVLDADTRTRLSILINEAGAAFTGRREDFNQLLNTLPHAIVKGDALLGRLVSDNHTLADTVASSDRFIGRVAAERHALGRMVDVVGRAAAPLAQRRAEMRQTLARAPGTLRTLNAFLGDLKRTTVPLGPAARDLAATAPALSATLAQVDPFRVAADPALRTAARVAPSLTGLAAGTTPVLRRSAPVVGRLATLGQAAVPVSGTLDHSIDNLLAIVQNWSRAIQFRDGLSHIFRGEALFSPETFRSLVERLGVKLNGNRRRHGGTTLPAPAPRPSVPVVKPSVPKVPKVPTPRLPLPPAVKQRLDSVTGSLPQKPATPPPPDAPLLDYLLGH